MKILGRTSIVPRTRDVTVGFDDKGKEIRITLRPLSYSEITKMDRDMPAPLAPSTGEVKRDPRTKAVIKRGGQPVLIRDETDPAHLKRVAVVNTAHGVAMFVIGAGDQLDVRAQREGEGAEAYYLDLLEEMHHFGLDQGRVLALVSAATALSLPMSNAEMALMRTSLGTMRDDPPEDPKRDEGNV